MKHRPADMYGLEKLTNRQATIYSLMLDIAISTNVEINKKLIKRLDLMLIDYMPINVKQTGRPKNG